MIKLLLSFIMVTFLAPNYDYVVKEYLNTEPVLHNEVSDAVNAYEEYVNSVPGMAENCTFSLIYIDEDDIPELVVYGCCEADGTTICCYYNGEVHEKQLRRLGFTYIEKENLICNGAGHMDVYYDYVYSIENGEFVEVGMGDYGGNQYIGTYYKWNDASVSEEEYYRQLNAVYDKSKDITPLGYYESVEKAYQNLESYSDAIRKLYASADRNVLEAIKAYENYLENESYDSGEIYCRLIYIDDDNIPELYVVNIGESNKLCFYGGGKVYENKFADFSWASLYHMKNENLFLIYGIAADRNHYDIVYTNVQNELVEIARGENRYDYDSSAQLERTTYIWNGQKVSEKEYQESLNAVFDRDNADWLGGGGYDTIEEAYLRLSLN